MRERTQSMEIGKIVEALSKAQLQFEPIIKEAKAHQNKFAPLPDCLKYTRKALCDNGLSVSQPMNVLDDGRIIIETTLGHISGEYFKSYTDLTQLINNAKGLNPLHTWGGIITYTRRYAYLAIIGAASEDEDNDGRDIENKNNGNNKSHIKHKISKDQIIHLQTLLSNDIERLNGILKWAHVSSIDDMSIESYEVAIQLLIKEKDAKRLEGEIVK